MCPEYNQDMDNTCFMNLRRYGTLTISLLPYLITMPYLYLRVTMTTYPPEDLLDMLALDHSD